MAKIRLDEFDRKILKLLQENGRITNAEIARQIAMAPSATLERVRRLEKQGIIKGYQAVLDSEQLGLGFTAFVFIRESTAKYCRVLYSKLAEIEEVQEVHSVAGEDGFLIKVRATNTTHFREILQNKILELEDIGTTRSVIVLETVKESLGLPILEEDK